MAITDINISEELQTNAPSIKYRGNEGPKSPQQQEQMMMASLQEEYQKYVFEMKEQGIRPMSLQEFIQRAIAEGQMSGGQSLPQDPTGPVLPNRQMAAYGGIMGLDGRRQYGLGSKLKRAVRKIIPNEVAKVAEVAAPFVAPFNPLAAGLMSGIGGFDRHGSIGKGLKSGLMNYGLGQGARYLGGAGIQEGWRPWEGMDNMKYGFSKPTGTNKRFFDDWFKSKSTTPGTTEVKDVIATGNEGDEILNLGKIKQEGTGGIMESIKGLIPDSTLGKIVLGGGSIALGTQLLGQGPEETVGIIMDRGEGLDIEGIRAEVLDAYNDKTGEKILALRAKYPFLGNASEKNLKAEGGRIGYANGVGPVLDIQEDDLSISDFMQDQGIPQGQMASYGYDDAMADSYDMYLEMKGKGLLPPNMTFDDFLQEMSRKKKGSEPNRVMAQEGGIMDLGGKEKDYRNTGGFVDLGAKEKADDVPARLSVNEFVMTADAVRGAGGGDIDKGAEIMENVMKNLEKGGTISEESQGLQGAQEMFNVSERLSEVV